jgi:hypothetical protein
MESNFYSDFFNKLTRKKARLFLNNYLAKAAEGFNILDRDLTDASIIHDYSLASLPKVLEWFSKRMVKVKKDPDYSLPKWITETDDYKINLYHFDENSEILILRASYYWGECFVKNTKLSWAPGKYSSNKNQPVLQPFIRNMEMMPYSICENLIRSIIDGKKADDIVNKCINSWLGIID